MTMNNDARNRLRAMGGIMASSPELMAVAQGYQLGGPVAPMAPPTIPRPLMDQTTMGRMLRPSAPSMPPLAGTIPIVPRYDAPDSVGVNELLERTSLLDTTDDARARRGFGRSAYRSGLDGPVVSLPEDTSIIRPKDVSKEELLRQTQEERKALEDSQPAPGVFRSSDEKRQAERLAETERRLQGDIASDENIQRSREETVMAQPLVPKKLDQSVIDRMLELAKKDPNIPVPDDTPTTEDDDVTAPPPGGDGPPRKETKRDLRSRYNEKIALFKEIYGTDDKDEAQDRAMSLAMIGLAIAAGQSPDALTNIAQGLMVGAQGIGARREDERERERGLKTLALQTAIDQMGAETEAEAEAARQKAEAMNRLDVARIRAGGDSGAEQSRAEYLYKSTFDTTYDALINPDPLTGREPLPIPQAIQEAARAAAAAAPTAPSAQGRVVVPTAPAAPGLDELTDEERTLLGG